VSTTSERAAQGARQLASCLDRVDAAQLDELEDAIVAANRIFVVGAGRSLFMLRAFAMRLMHLGFTAYVVGDTTTPAFRPGDLLVAGSGSGTTSGVVNVARKAKELGGEVACFTIKPESALGQLADHIVAIPAYTDKENYEGMEKPVLPGGSEFESSILLLGDAMVVPLGEKRGIPTDRAFDLHANLE
jgi:6-phospho-3-hexuloisomerase